MSLNRIRISKEQADFVKSLLSEDGSTGPFQTYADIIAFAAALGVIQKHSVSVTNPAKEPAPISVEIFVSRGYDWLFKLLAIALTQDPKILSVHDPQAEEQRLRIFEEYANGGLEKLRERLKGSVDYTERISLIINQTRSKKQDTPDEFDLSRFL
ncbi:DNA phosphorothioation-associated protein 4 [Gloeocapsa sp. PCC 73106]|uniref:DNA phosphorothioation-associated protein 4 n=1 Tax=Gloeocapsa sp. PCC 73106 TaxID=102232 RepID=UPI0002AB9C69|nr:DNA phosphorothioation-associated protein 4 [Gloeocapsa sp. PCC 73106]ELR98749.1 dnd system-associated protein 4 [Gloeocapsa sp. PCC 73106]